VAKNFESKKVKPVTNKRGWTISIAASVLLVVGVLASLFGAGFRLYEVKTPSMGTVAPVGTMVAVHAQTSYAIGDVVTYERNGRSYTHRIVDQNAQGFITKGDINTSVDALPVPNYQIVGKVVFYGKYLGMLAQGLPALLIGWALVYAITLLPRVRASWRWQIRFIGWSLVVSIVAMWLRPWVNLVMLGYLPSDAGGVDMHLVNTGIFPVSVLGKVISSGQDVVVNQAVLDSRGHYTVMPQLALNAGWFMVLLAICLTPMFGSLLVRVEDDVPEVKKALAPVPVTRPVWQDWRQNWRRFAPVALTVTASVLAVVMILQLNTNAAFAATLRNSTDTAGSRTWFTCQNAETGTTGARFAWALTATGTQNDLTGNGRSGTMTNSGTAATASSSSPCPRDTQGSVMFNGGTCVYVSGKVTGTETYSEEVWFRTTNKSLNGKLMGFADVTTPASQAHYDRHIYIDPTGRVVFGVWPSTQSVVSSPAGTNYADGLWHHVVATSAPGKISLYLDGNLVGSRADTAGQEAYSGYWMVGCGLLKDWQDAAGTPQNFSSYYTGNLRLAAVYDVTLSATQVKEHYLAGTA
jgi:signal peptidase I